MTMQNEAKSIAMNNWVKDFDSWDVCDQVCLNLFDKTRFAYQKAIEWSKRKEEFVKRAGFVLMAVLAVHHKKMNDCELIPRPQSGLPMMPSGN